MAAVGMAQLAEYKRERQALLRSVESLKRLRRLSEAGLESENAVEPLLTVRGKQAVALENRLYEIEQWLNTLPAQRAEIFYYRYIQGLKWAEVARKTGYSVGYCKKINTQSQRASWGSGANGA